MGCLLLLGLVLVWLVLPSLNPWFPLSRSSSRSRSRYQDPWEREGPSRCVHMTPTRRRRVSVAHTGGYNGLLGGYLPYPTQPGAERFGALPLQGPARLLSGAPTFESRLFISSLCANKCQLWVSFGGCRRPGTRHCTNGQRLMG